MELERSSFLRLGSAGLIGIALDACGGGSLSPTWTGFDSRSRVNPNCKGSTKVTHAPPDKFGQIAWWQLNAYDCNNNLVGQLIIYTATEIADIWFTGYGDSTLSLSDQRWTKKEVIELYEDLVITPTNDGDINGAIVGSSPSQAISSWQCDPSTGMYTALIYPQDQYQGSYIGSLQKRERAISRAVSPLGGCLSARLMFGSACGASFLAALAAPESFGLSLLALSVAAAAVASAGIDMGKACR